MAYHVIVTVLIIGGIIGWLLFFYIISQIHLSRKKEMKLISEIKKDINSVKDLIKL
jgi:uncharacterized membrane protein YciS (DUF1049 family)